MCTVALEKYNKFIENLNKSETPLLAFSCPHCGFQLQTIKNESSNTWDATSACPSCDKIFLKITNANCGNVEVRKI